MIKLDLPTDRYIARWVARNSFRIDRGTRASLVHYRARQRFVGRGERLGLTYRGRIGDYMPLLSAVRRQATFRRNRVSPKRRVLLVIDLRHADDDASLQRLLSSAVLVSALVLGIPDATLSVTAAGVQQPVYPAPYAGIDNLSLVRRSVAALGDVPHDPGVSASKFRFVCSADEGAHLVLVSHYLQRTMVERIPFAVGGTVFHIQPPSGFFGLRGAGMTGSASLEPATVSGEVMQRRYQEAAEYFSSRLVRTFSVGARKSTISAMTEALGE